MKLPLIFLAAALSLTAASNQEAEHSSTGIRRLYAWSLTASIAANAADISSSYGKREANPLLAGPGHSFGRISVLQKGGIAGGMDLIQLAVLRKKPRGMRTVAIMNFAVAGALAGIAAHNFAVH